MKFKKIEEKYTELNRERYQYREWEQKEKQNTTGEEKRTEKKENKT